MNEPREEAYGSFEQEIDVIHTEDWQHMSAEDRADNEEWQEGE